MCSVNNGSDSHTRLLRNIAPLKEAQFFTYKHLFTLMSTVIAINQDAIVCAAASSLSSTPPALSTSGSSAPSNSSEIPPTIVPLSPSSSKDIAPSAVSSALPQAIPVATNSSSQPLRSAAELSPSSSSAANQEAPLASLNSVLSSVFSFLVPKKLPPLLVEEGENAREKDPLNLPEQIETKLILEPEPLPKIVLVQENDELSRKKDGTQGITVLVPEVERPAPTLLVHHQEAPKATILYSEPEFDPPAILYVEPETEREHAIEKKLQDIRTTRLMLEPNPDDAPSPTALCRSREIREIRAKCKGKITTQIIEEEEEETQTPDHESEDDDPQIIDDSQN